MTKFESKKRYTWHGTGCVTTTVVYDAGHCDIVFGPGDLKPVELTEEEIEWFKDPEPKHATFTWIPRLRL